MQTIFPANTSLGAAVRGALTTALCLGGGLAAGVAAGFAVSKTSSGLAAALALLVFALAGAGWGRLMAAVTSSSERTPMAVAGALTFGPGILIAALGLTALEGPLLESGSAPDLPIYVLYRLVFPPASLLVAAFGGLVLGLAQRRRRGAVSTAMWAGLATGLAFLAAVLLMDAIGYRVGAPGAEARATMLTVTFVGSVAGALAGGAAIGLSLHRQAADAPSPVA
jgi:hypothetical protein